MIKNSIILILNLFPVVLLGQPALNVQNFGAKTDGKSDARKAIQAAINAADSSVKTIIYFPEGIYTIASYDISETYLENFCLKMHSNLEFRGAGPNTIIKLADHLFDKKDKNANAHLFFGKKVNNISFYDFSIDMNGMYNRMPKDVIKNNAGIFVSLGNNVLIENMIIKNCAGTNMVNIMSAGSGLTIKNSKFINGGNYVGSQKLINKDQIDFSFLYSEWDDTHISNITIEQQNIDIALANYTGGIELHGDNSSVTNCSLTGCFPAIYVTSSGKPMQNVKVSNNRLINCVKGISFWLIYPMKDIVIEYNSIELTHHRSKKSILSVGIEIPNGNLTTYNKDLANAAPVSNLLIKNNHIKATEISNLSAGMSLHSIQHSSIDKNIIEGMNYAGIALVGSKWGSQNVNVSTNNFIDFTPNKSEQTVAGYIVITDTYTPTQKNAPGLKNVTFEYNLFTRNPAVQGKSVLQKGKFFGAFIALPKNMIKEIQFQQNIFSDSLENVFIVPTD